MVFIGLKVGFLRTEILATDGKLTRRLLWMNRTRGGLQAGWFSKGFHYHLTYHNDGSRWETEGDSPAQPEGYGPRLDKFDGIEQISGFTFPTQVTEITEEFPYQMKKLDAIIHVDVRAYPEGGILCDVYLLEPGRFDLIDPRKNDVPMFAPFSEDPTEIHLLTTVNPWVLVTISPFPYPPTPFVPEAKIKRKKRYVRP